MAAFSVRRSLMTSAAALAVFGAVAAVLRWLPATAKLDESVALWLNQKAVAFPRAVEIFHGITYLGSSAFQIDLSIGVVLILLLYRQWRLASAWVIVELISIVLIERSKLFFGRARPTFNGLYVLEDSFSFPSGHALSSMVTFGMLAYLVAIGFEQSAIRRITVALCAALIVLIGFSRLILGVHYLSDVVGGYALGAAWLAFAVALLEDVRAHYGPAGAKSGGTAGQ
jgi:undecaprenyl-diphosphatase